MGKLKVVVPAIKHADGTISKAPNAKYSHEEIIKKTGKKGEHGFVLSDGTFASRERSAKIAKAVGEVKNPGDKLHSHELRKAIGVKKAKI